MHNSVRLGRVAGVDIRIHSSWLIVFALVTWSLAASYFPQEYPSFGPGTCWLLGVLAALLLFVAVLLHELAHSLVAQARGLSVDSITLYAFGGVSNIASEPQKAGTEFLLAGAGPLTSLLLGALSYVGAVALKDVNLGAYAVLQYLATINTWLAIFNLLPGYPLDGGRVLHALLWRATGDRVRATRMAGGVGQGIAYVLIFGGIWLFFTGNVLDGIWMAFIGWFLASAAEGTVQHVTLEQRFTGVSVADVMQRNPVAVADDVSLEEAVHSYLLAYNLSALPVTHLGRPAGLITLADVSKQPRQAWSQITVGAVLDGKEPVPVLRPDQGVMEALELMAKAHADAALVAVNGDIVGLLSQGDAERYLQLRTVLDKSKPHHARAA